VATAKTATESKPVASAKATSESKALPTAKTAAESKPVAVADSQATTEPKAAAAEARKLLEAESRMLRALELLEQRIGAIQPQPPPQIEPITHAPKAMRATLVAHDTLATRATPIPQEAQPPCEATGAMEVVTTSFRRSMSEAIERRLEEIILPLAGLCHKLKEEARHLTESHERADFNEVNSVLADSVSELESLLRSLGGAFIAPQVGEPYDPLIHVAVGASTSGEAETNVVTKVLRPGYKSGRGRVVMPARVLVGRR
jgi:hypothetical protein